MSRVVVDSSVLIASVFSETYSQQATNLLVSSLHNRVTLHAPHLLHYELVAVTRKAVRSGRISPVEGLALRDRLLKIPVTLHFSEEPIQRAYDLAQEHNLSKAYDSQYLAVAERLRCDVWTGDERLFNAVRATFSSIRWLGESEG